jgi:FixJ family two-component response regulator
MDVKINFIRAIFPHLTLKQSEVLYYSIFEGKTEKEIAELMQISPQTVKNHKTQLSESYDEFGQRLYNLPSAKEIQTKIIQILWDKLNPPN